MDPLHASHDILVAGPDFDSCGRKVLLFFDKNILVHYDTVEVAANEAINGENHLFWERLKQGEAANQRVLAELLAELRQEGFDSVAALLDMKQGYHSKLFHTIAHLLDGFFGIDTCLYNLEEDSHWVSESLRQQITAEPARYWLLKVDAVSKGKTADRLSMLRTGKEDTGEHG